jgi:hypothetical protein
MEFDFRSTLHIKLLIFQHGKNEKKLLSAKCDKYEYGAGKIFMPERKFSACCGPRGEFAHILIISIL